MKVLLEVDFPDDFQFPEQMDWPTGACDDCPFYVIDTHETEICFLTTPVNVGDQEEFECSWVCPLHDGSKKARLSETRRLLQPTQEAKNATESV